MKSRMLVKERVAVQSITIAFAGSFQVRLGTNPFRPDDSPNEPDRAGQSGFTFAYDEQPFDRVIRLCDPVQLRIALVDPWEDAQVIGVGGFWGTDVEMDGDSLIGQKVSLGSARLAHGNGGGIGYEVLDDFAFSIGGTLFTARQARETRMTGTSNMGKEWRAHYETNKERHLTEATLGLMHPARRAYLSEYYEDEKGKGGAVRRHVQTYSSYYCMEADMPDIPLNHVMLNPHPGILTAARRVADRLTWTLSLNFSRFDGDTLCGRIRGVLVGRDAELDRGRKRTRG